MNCTQKIKVEVRIIDLLDLICKFSVISKNLPNVYKSCPKMISLENDWFWQLNKNCLRIKEIWAK